MNSEDVMPPNPVRKRAPIPFAGVRWVREWQEQGQDTFRIGREGADLVAEWAGLGVLRSSVDGRHFEISCAEGVEPHHEAKWRAGSVPALLRHLEGRMTLHASAVALQGRAFVFLGESGSGKSTCAAHLCARLGAELVADDLTQVDVVRGSHVVNQTEGAHWLLPDSASALGRTPVAEWKRPLPAPRLAAASTPVASILALSFADGPPAIAPIRGEGAFAAINRSYVRFLVDDLLAHLRDLDLMSNLVAATPIVSLSRPRSLSRLDDVATCFADFCQRIPMDSTTKAQAP